MPNIEWNKSYWIKDIQNFNEGLSRKYHPNEKHYGERWGEVEKDPILKSIKEKFVLPFVNEDKSVLEKATSEIDSFARLGKGERIHYRFNLNKIVYV